MPILIGLLPHETNELIFLSSFRSIHVQCNRAGLEYYLPLEITNRKGVIRSDPSNPRAFVYDSYCNVNKIDQFFD